MADWLTDGGNPQRTAWQKNEHILNVSNVKGMKLLWKYKTDNEPREMHALFPPLIVGRVLTAAGPKQVAVVAGVSDNIYAIDVATGTLLWKHHFDTTFSPPPGVELRHAVPGRHHCHAGDRPGQDAGQLHRLCRRVGWAPASARCRDRESGRALRAVHAAQRQAVRAESVEQRHLHDERAGMRRQSESTSTRSTSRRDARRRSIRAAAACGDARGPSIGRDGSVYTGTGDGSYNPELRSYGTAVIAVKLDPATKKLKLTRLLRSAERRVSAEARHRSAGDRPGVRTRRARVARAGKQGMPHVAARHERAGRRGPFDGRASVAAHLQ